MSRHLWKLLVWDSFIKSSLKKESEFEKSAMLLTACDFFCLFFYLENVVVSSSTNLSGHCDDQMM